MANVRLPRLSKKYLEVPQYITQSSLQDITEVFDSKDRTVLREAYKLAVERGDLLSGKTSLNIFGESPQNSPSSQPYGVLSVEGLLTCKSTGWEALCGGTSYEGLISQMKQFAKDEVKEVFMVVDSGGGEAYRCLETSRELRKIADENDIKLTGYVDGTSASAGYALLSACTEVIANSDARVGSIGAVMSLINDSAHLEKEGYKRVFISAGDSKIPFDNDGQFKEEFLQDLQEGINKSRDKFVSLIDEQRPNMSRQQILNTEAKVFDAEEALRLGLVDKLMSVSDFQKEYLAGDTTSAKQNTKSKETFMSETNTPQFSQEDFLAMQAKLAAFENKEIENTKLALSTKLDSTPFLSGCKESLMSFFMADNITEENKTLMNSVIEAASTEMSVMATNASTKLAEVENEAAGKIKLAEDAAEVSKLEAESAKEEFATTTFSETSQTKDTNVQLSHKEKLATAVAAEKAKNNRK